MNTEVTSIRAEIADLRGYLEGLPEHLRTGPYVDSYRRRLHMLFEQLAAEELTETAAVANSTALDLRVTTQQQPEAHRIPAQFLGDLLQRWQTLFSALGQAAAGKPTSRGLIPAEILQETTLDVVAFAPGSFVTRLVLEDTPQTKLPTTGDLGLLAFEHFEKLCAAGADHHELSVLLHQLKGRVLSAYTKLLELLDSNQASLQIALAEPRKSALRSVRLERAAVHQILPMLTRVSVEEQSEQVLVGILNAANRRTGTFEIDLGDEGTVSGRVAHPILEGVTIGGRYEFKLSQVVTKDLHTGQLDASWSLLEVRDVEA